METQQGIIEAVLFASGEPIAIDKIAAALELPPQKAQQVVTAVAEHFNRVNSGIKIVQLEDSYQMCTRPEFEEQVRIALALKQNTPLSAAALEVLAIVAYHQPVTRAFLEQVRGVDSGGVLNGLFAKGLVEERGRLELPGRPLLYGTTEHFLRCMGLETIEALPPVPQPQESQANQPQQDAQQT